MIVNIGSSELHSPARRFPTGGQGSRTAILGPATAGRIGMPAQARPGLGAGSGEPACPPLAPRRQVVPHPGADTDGDLAPEIPLRATAVFDASGHVLYQTPGADRLLESLNTRAGQGGSPPCACRQVAGPVRAVIRALVEAEQGRTASAPQVRWVRVGQAVVEASWLAPSGAELGSLGRLIAVRVEVGERASDRAARALRAGGATPAQTRVGVLLAFGYSKPQIARKLGVKESSVQDAARKLYTRLGVRNAAELGAHLWLKWDGE